jgi:hypothetical protein
VIEAGEWAPGTLELAKNGDAAKSCRKANAKADTAD